jgi:hypothetical protein
MEDTATSWRKSSYSGNGGNCVEAAQRAGTVMVRDSQLAEQSSVLTFSADAWRAFTAQLKHEQ